MRFLESIALLVVAHILLSGCSGTSHDSRLMAIESMVSEHPEEALVRLDSIDAGYLSDADRHLYDFLRVKACDKAYITHTSDSLILDVTDYYSRHEKERYPEALYYGGRVYSDLGDYPTSLQYFQDALENLPAGSKDYDLRGRILSQTGRLLNILRLYKEAIPYIEESIEISREHEDTIGAVYDLQLLGSICLRANEFDIAEMHLKEALRMSVNLPDSYKAKSEMSLARLMYKKSQIDSALNLIRGVPDRVRSITRSAAIDYACDIYYSAGIFDTAYMYAQELIHSDSPRRDTGYYIILQPGCRDFISSDTLDQYILNYRSLLETYHNHNEHPLALTQQAQYNYRLHERERERAEASQKRLRGWLICAIGILLLLVLIILYLKNRNKSRIIQLQQAIDNVRRLKEELAKVNESVRKENEATSVKAKEEMPDESQSTVVSIQNTISNEFRLTEHQLRERLMNELINLSENSEGKVTVPYRILDSEVLTKLRELTDEGQTLKPDDELWNEIEGLILETSPEFRRRLTLLTRGKLSSVEYHTALLIKCGIRPSEMSQLLGKSNGAIISRRETLSQKVFDKKVSIKHIDNIIRLL